MPAMRTIGALLLAALVAVQCAARNPDPAELDGYSFDRYVKDYRKNYQPGSAEWRRRAEVFAEAVQAVRLHNAQGGKSYTRGVNHMSDWTHEEKRRIRGLRVSMRRYADGAKYVHPRPQRSASLPSEVDYRRASPPVLTAVKDQGYCGNCWAHSAVESIESHWAITHGDLYVLSTQQMTSCTPNPQQCGGTGGCEGAIEQLGFQYVTRNGISSEWVIPFTSHNGADTSCNRTGMAFKARTDVRLVGYAMARPNDADSMAEVLSTKGPLSVSVDASSWSDYHGGIFDGCKGNITMDQAVQLVGYGYDWSLGQHYWTVRNSWTPNFGEHGYIRVRRYPGKESCTWDNRPQDNDGCKGQTAPEYACGMCGIAYSALYPLPTK